MQNKLSSLIFISVAAFSLCSGCSSVKTPAPSPQSYNITSSPKVSNEIKPQKVVQNIEKTIPIPKQLETIGSNAEGIYIDAAKKDWKKVNDRINLIKTNYNELKPMMQMTATSKSIINSMGIAIDNLDKQAKAKKVYETRFDANQLSKHIPDTYNIFRPSLAGDITKLGYLGREIELNAEKAEWASAKNNLDTASSTWSVLKPKVNNTYNSDITGFSKVLHDLNKSIADKNTVSTKNNVKKMLNGIGIIQSDLTTQGTTV